MIRLVSLNPALDLNDSKQDFLYNKLQHKSITKKCYSHHLLVQIPQNNASVFGFCLVTGMVLLCYSQNTENGINL